MVTYTLSWKSNWKHSTLEYQIKELLTSQDTSRSAITNKAIRAAVNFKDWKTIRAKLADLKPLDIPVIKSMQARTDDEQTAQLEGVRKTMLESLSDDIKVLQTHYMIQLLWLHYLDHLQLQAKFVGIHKPFAEDLSGPDMVKRLVELLLLNRHVDAPVIENIKQLLLEWRE